MQPDENEQYESQFQYDDPAYAERVYYHVLAETQSVVSIGTALDSNGRPMLCVIVYSPTLRVGYREYCAV